MKKKKHIIRIILGLMVLLPVLLFGLIQTPPGKALLATGLEHSLSRSEHLEVRIGRIRGWIPAAVQIDRVEIGDAEGIWLSVEDLSCRWMIHELATPRVRLTRVGAQTIELHRFPETFESDRPATSETAAFRPGELILDKLLIDQLKLGKAVAGVPLEYTVRSGGIHLHTSGRLTGGLTVEGDAEGQVELDATLGGEEPRLHIKAALDQLVKPATGLDRLSGKADAMITREGIRGRASVAVRKDKLGGQLTAEYQFAGRQLLVPQFNISGNGFSSEGTLAIDFSDGPIDILMDVEAVDASTNTYALHTAAAVTVSNGSWAVGLHPLQLRYLDQVCAVLEGEIRPEQLALAGLIEEFDIAALPLPGLSAFTGGVGGTLSLTGSPEAPELRAELDVLRLASAEDALDELPELNFHISGRLGGGQMQATSVITNTTTGRMTAGFRMPCAFSLEPFNLEPVWREAKAEMSADVEVGILNQLALLNDQRISGALNIDLVYDEQLSGTLRMNQGEYEHFSLGVVMRDLALDLEAVDDGIKVHTATATDGDAGRLAMTGGVVSNQLALVMELSRAAVVRRDDVEGSLSGRLEVSGPLARPEVVGHLTVDRVDILIDNFPPALPPLLEDYDARDGTRKVAKAGKQVQLPFDLDLTVDLADQVYTDASMINTIWGGNLQVRGGAQEIRVQGMIEPRRGYVAFIGKKFRFIEGQIDVAGAVPTMPSMNQLTAEYSRGDFTARLILNGRLDNPDFRLESTPAMPEDEILSHVLFNRDSSSITPYQAFQIAAAARQLSGGLSGPGFMYQMRRAVGVDTLEWREGAGEGDASSVAAGKYLTSALYVEINRSLDEKGGTGMMAEFELSRHFSVETSTGPQMRPGIGVNWKNDY